METSVHASTPSPFPHFTAGTFAIIKRSFDFRRYNEFKK